MSTWLSIQDGDSITAEGINDNFTAVEDLVNDIGPGDVMVEALTREHLPSVVGVAGEATIYGVDHAYTVLDSPYNPDYDEASVNAWSEINSNGGGTTSAADFMYNKTDPIVLQTGGIIETALDGVLVMFNGHIKKLWQTENQEGLHDIHAIFRISVTDSSGNKRFLTGSERFADSELSWYNHVPTSLGAADKQWKMADIAIRHVITASDVIDGSLQTVKVHIAVVAATPPSGALFSGYGTCGLSGCDLAVIPFQKLLTAH